MVQQATTKKRQPLLAALGVRVRALRDKRGLTRKRLAQKSGVSERFLAQLENGSGNISVLRLSAIALAMGTKPAELLQDIGTVPSGVSQTRRIALIGLRGAGKSTLGRAIADRLGLAFIELTDAIEQQSGLSVSEIFNLYGNEGYRQLERQALQAVISDNRDCILATSGGITEDIQAFDLLLGAFHTVWLTATPDEHMSRVRNQGDLRPMEGHAQAMQSLKAILGTRSRDYARADAFFDTSGRGVDACSDELANLLRAAGFSKIER